MNETSNIEHRTSNIEEKRRWPLELAEKVAASLVRELSTGAAFGFCQAAGSVRRKRATVGDVEIIYVPLVVLRQKPGEMFPSEQDAVAVILEELMKSAVIRKRRNVNGDLTWGAQNKLAEHVGTGMPLDFFSTTEVCWWNYLVCRTGPAESNQAIASAARRKGWKWQPYSSGFVGVDEQGNETSQRAVMASEREVFEFVGLPYEEPQNR